jgi:hypothetical protein
MDYLTNKELKGLKGDIKASQYALEAEKYSFGKKLVSQIGPEMMEQLSKPKEEQNAKPQKKKKCWFLRLIAKKGDS